VNQSVKEEQAPLPDLFYSALLMVLLPRVFVVCYLSWDSFGKIAPSFLFSVVSLFRFLSIYWMVNKQRFETCDIVRRQSLPSPNPSFFQ
jgi:hypothetical protein